MMTPIARLLSFSILIACCFALSLAACSRRPAVNPDPFFEDWKARAEVSKPLSPTKDDSTDIRELSVKSRQSRRENVPPESPQPSGQPDPPALQGFETRVLSTAPVSLKMYHTDIGVLLRALARSVDQSIMISENVKGMANINAINQPWDTVFLGILKTYGLNYDWIGDIIRIKTRTDIDHEWEMEKAMLLQKELRWQFRHVEEFRTRIFYIDYADAEELSKILAQMITGSEKKQSNKNGDTVIERNIPVVTVDQHNNAIIIYATRDDIEQAGELIKELDKPTPQILIEAKIVEANRETARELGVQWGGLASTQGGGLNQYITPGARSAGILGQPLMDGSGNPIQINPTSGIASNFPAALQDTAGLTIGWVGERVGESVLTVQLSALQREGKLNILSAPSITTLDNQKATIESGRDVPFQTVEDDEVKIIFKKAVLMLEVTPHVIDDQLLKLTIITHKDELDFSNPVAGNPTIITKNAQTNIILFDGQTTVIGGLSKETTNDTEAGIPLLKDLPFLGSLFRSQGRNNNLEEILIFITPHILAKQKTAAVLPQEDVKR